MSRHGLRPALKFQGLRYARTLDEAFRTPRYGAAIEFHTRPSLWQRFLRAVWRWL